MPDSSVQPNDQTAAAKSHTMCTRCKASTGQSQSPQRELRAYMKSLGEGKNARCVLGIGSLHDLQSASCTSNGGSERALDHPLGSYSMLAYHDVPESATFQPHVQELNLRNGRIAKFRR